VSRGLVVVAALIALAGCGYVGDPLPPALNIPVAVSDFRAFEYGEEIIAEFTLPNMTTDGLPVTEFTEVQIAIGVGPDPFSMDAWAAGAMRYKVNKSAPGPVEHRISIDSWIGKATVIAVRAAGPKGKWSSWSNPSNLEVIPPVATPRDVEVRNVEKGVAVRWQGAAPKFRVFRAEGDGAWQPLGDAEKPEYVDETTVYGTRYQYLVQALASETQQSVVTGPVAITPDDAFAPAIPAGVSIVATPQSIELAWERNTEPDFAGYNVYRAVDQGAFTAIATGVEVPTYSDSRIESGKRYRYQVSSVDAKGNQSDRSAPVEVVAQ
jgi:hypothetical protein